MLAVKFVIFFAFFQSVVLSLLNTMGVLKPIGQISAEDVSTLIQNFLVCFEMMVAAGLHLKAFGWKEFVLRPIPKGQGREEVEGELEYGLKTPVLLALGDALSPVDFLRDIKEAPAVVRSNRRRRRAKERARREDSGEGRKKTRKGRNKFGWGAASASVVALGTEADVGGDVGAGAGAVVEKTKTGKVVGGSLREEEERIGDGDQLESDSDYDSDYTTESTLTNQSGTSSLSSGLEDDVGTSSSGLLSSQSEVRLIPK